MPKIYFAGSIRGGREDLAIYIEIINHLKKYGEVLTEHIGDSKLNDAGEATLSDEFIHNRDMDWLLKADILIAEVTKASLGVGYEIGTIVERNKWANDKKIVICLYRKQIDKRLSAMIKGSSGVINLEYESLEDIKSCLDRTLNSLDIIPQGTS